jgi:anhydro-N-acetylmuramic acid kinase
MAEFYIGLMSGTSLDGVDGVLVDFAAFGHGRLEVCAHTHRSFAPELGAALLALNASGPDELHRAALAANALALEYAAVVATLLRDSGTAAHEVRAVGAHGQTVRHRPGEFDGLGYTLQLNNPALLAERCGIDVVADLRSRDVAAGGQGAPLVPAFHRAVFARPDRHVAVLNVGGISNLTSLPAGAATRGWDCGPGNALMDHWCQRHTARAYDDAGRWAAGGQVDAGLLRVLRADPYFGRSPPKSTGRDLFNPQWLQLQLDHSGSSAPTRDVQATLAELTASVCAGDVRRWAEHTEELLVCGGGARNTHLMDRLAALLPGVAVLPTDARGLPAQQVEACAFAWLARAYGRDEPSSLPEVTGARAPHVLGARYPAR